MAATGREAPIQEWSLFGQFPTLSLSVKIAAKRTLRERRMRSRQHKAAMRRLMIKSLLCMLLLPGASAVWSDGGILLWPLGVIFSPMGWPYFHTWGLMHGKGPTHRLACSRGAVGHSGPFGSKTDSCLTNQVRNRRNTQNS